ncbi:hypothetical protein P691DRAFT_805730, partial [Macrolepiota fuliginosa MF-IS2]
EGKTAGEYVRRGKWHRKRGRSWEVIYLTAGNVIQICKMILCMSVSRCVPSFAPPNVIHASTAQDPHASYHNAVLASEVVKHPLLSSNPSLQRKTFQPASTKKPRENTTRNSRFAKLDWEEAVDSASTVASGGDVVFFVDSIALDAAENH